MPHSQSNPVHVVSFSGGKTSAYLVHLMEQKRKHHGWNVQYVFMDTGAEAPQTYQFVRDIVAHWQIDLHCIRTVVDPRMGIGCTYREVTLEELIPDLQPWQDMLAKYGSPTITKPFCTSRMKTEPHLKFIRDKWGLDNTVTWLGIRADEPHRLTHYQSTPDMFNPRKPEKEAIRYLAELSNITKQGIADWWQAQPFQLALEPHAGNCVFCVKKSEAKLWACAKQFPQMAQHFKQVVTADSVRVKDSDKYDKGVLYRGKISIDSVIRMAAKLPAQALMDKVHMDDEFSETDPTLCSSSCEIDLDHFAMEMQSTDEAA